MQSNHHGEMWWCHRCYKVNFPMGKHAHMSRIDATRRDASICAHTYIHVCILPIYTHENVSGSVYALFLASFTLSQCGQKPHFYYAPVMRSFVLGKQSRRYMLIEWLPCCPKIIYVMSQKWLSVYKVLILLYKALTSMFTSIYPIHMFNTTRYISLVQVLFTCSTPVGFAHLE